MKTLHAGMRLAFHVKLATDARTRCETRKEKRAAHKRTLHCFASNRVEYSLSPEQGHPQCPVPHSGPGAETGAREPHTSALGH